MLLWPFQIIWALKDFELGNIVYRQPINYFKGLNFNCRRVPGYDIVGTKGQKADHDYKGNL